MNLRDVVDGVDKWDRRIFATDPHGLTQTVERTGSEEGRRDIGDIVVD